MVFELIGVIVAGVLGGGVASLIRRLVPMLPRWSIPAAAGLGMLFVSITLEYAWFERTRAALPDQVEVALTNESSAPWRPWTYAVPLVNRFIAVDRRTLQTHDAAPTLRMVDLVAFARWTPPSRLTVVVDCADGRRVDLVPGVTLTEDGHVEGGTWHAMGRDHAVTRIACRSA